MTTSMDWFITADSPYFTNPEVSLPFSFSLILFEQHVYSIRQNIYEGKWELSEFVLKCFQSVLTSNFLSINTLEVGNETRVWQRAAVNLNRSERAVFRLIELDNKLSHSRLIFPIMNDFRWVSGKIRSRSSHKSLSCLTQRVPLLPLEKSLTLLLSSRGVSS